MQKSRLNPVTIKIVQNLEGYWLPEYRGDLQTKILCSGYPTVSTYCRSHGISESRMSGIIRGTIWPSPTEQRKLTFGLGLTQKKLLELLGVENE